MRISKVIALSAVVVLFAAAPNTVGNVCQPKKPITCQASHLTVVAAPVAAAPAKAKSTTVKTKSPVKVQQAAACGPWVRWMCTAQPLV